MQYSIVAILALILQTLIVFPSGADKAPETPPSPDRGDDRRGAILAYCK